MSTQTSPGYNEYTNLSRLQWVHKPLQVITGIQTSLGYHEYTNLSRLYWFQSPPEIKSTQELKKHSQKREQWKLTRVYFTKVKNYTMVSHNPKLYMLSIVDWQ